MPYTIRTCKECGQKLHIRQKGKLINIKNRCVHFNDSTISAVHLEDMVIPIERILLSSQHLHELTQTCVMHKTPMIFKQYLQRFTELYHCPRCAIVDALIPTKYINHWKKRTFNKKWQPGDVKIIAVRKETQ